MIRLMVVLPTFVSSTGPGPVAGWWLILAGSNKFDCAKSGIETPTSSSAKGHGGRI